MLRDERPPRGTRGHSASVPVTDNPMGSSRVKRNSLGPHGNALFLSCQWQGVSKDNRSRRDRQGK